MGMCAFRLDDITPDMNWNHFNRICCIFDKYNVKPLLGVVPDNHDSSLQIEETREDFWDCIRCLQEKGYSISQHGYRHLYETKKSGILGLNPFSEFAGLSFSVQDEKIRKGKEILQKEGIYVTIFMAPGHTFDKNTLKALRKNGFLYVTDGYASGNYRYKGLSFIPSRNSKPVLEKGIDTICLHINSMSESDFNELEKFILHNRQSILNFEEICKKAIQKKNIMIWLEEYKTLKIRRFKYYLGKSIIIRQYLQETDDRNQNLKIKKRICYLPLLISRFIVDKFHFRRNGRN